MDGNLIRQLCELFQIAKTRTTPYHPSSNGQIERCNRTLLQTIRCFLKKRQHDWDIHLQQLVSAIRSAKNPQTGFSPNLMMLGREVFQPLDVILGSCKVSSGEKEVPQYLKNLVETMNSIHDIARENLNSAQSRQKRTYDLTANQRVYNVGDVVYKLDQSTKIGQSAKLKSPWKGPYVISDARPPVLYQITDRKADSWIHHDRIKLCEDREFPIWLRKLRNTILGNQTTEKETTSDCEHLPLDGTEIDLSALFDHNTPDVSSSDLLMSHSDSDLVNQTDTDETNQRDNAVSPPNEIEIVQTLENLNELRQNMDETLIYDLEDTDSSDPPVQDSGKRTRRRPAYLKDYIED